MPEIEEINKLVTFGLVDGKLRILQVNANVWGDVKGDIQGSVQGDIYGDVAGTVEGYIGRDVGANVGRHVLGIVNGNVDGSIWGDVKETIWGRVYGEIQGGESAMLSIKSPKPISKGRSPTHTRRSPAAAVNAVAVGGRIGAAAGSQGILGATETRP